MIRLRVGSSNHTQAERDVNILNEARENLEGIIDDLCRRFDYYTPRMYRQNTRKDYLNLAKCKKRINQKIRKAIKQQFQYIRRDEDTLMSFWKRSAD